LYLAVFVDMFSRKVVGWSIETRIKEEFVIDALAQAVDRKTPKTGPIIHIDRDAQYASKTFMNHFQLEDFV